MKLLISISLTVLFSFFIISASCKKDDSGNESELPPLTFEGKNTIGCRINGTPWIPKGIFSPGVTSYPTSGGYYVDPFYPNVHILLKTNSPDYEIELFCRNYSNFRFVAPGKYYFNKSTQPITGSYEKHNYGFCYVNGKEYMTDSLHTGWIDIVKSDSISNIISGKFEFTCYNSTDGKSYIITDGRFDFKTH